MEVGVLDKKFFYLYMMASRVFTDHELSSMSWKPLKVGTKSFWAVSVHVRWFMAFTSCFESSLMCSFVFVSKAGGAGGVSVAIFRLIAKPNGGVCSDCLKHGKSN